MDWECGTDESHCLFVCNHLAAVSKLGTSLFRSLSR